MQSVLTLKIKLATMHWLIFLQFALIAVNAKPLIPVTYYDHYVTPYLNPFVTAYSYHSIPFFRAASVANHLPVLNTNNLSLYRFAQGASPTIDVAASPVTHVAHTPPQHVYRAVAPAIQPAYSKYHSQGDDGSYSFGYYDGPSSKAEIRDADGNVRGTYNYIDSNGEVQLQHYVADKQGFRVAGTNLPIAPIHEVSGAPEPVEDTEEVREARAQFMKVFNEHKEKSRSKREADPAFYTASTYTAPQPSILLKSLEQPILSANSVLKYQTPASTSPLKQVSVPVVQPIQYYSQVIQPSLFRVANTAPVHAPAFHTAVVAHQPAFLTQPFYIFSNPDPANLPSFKSAKPVETVHAPVEPLAVSIRADLSPEETKTE